MSARERAASALSVSSNEFDRQLDDLAARAEGSGRAAPIQRQQQQLGQAEPAEENVAVMVRCRPLSKSERETQAHAEPATCVRVDEPNKCVEVAGERQFFFDQVFGPDSDDERVYMRSARRLVEAAFAGFNCTIFLYGQTGTGKTYTHSSLAQAAFEHLFALIQESNKQARFLIRASYYELYNEEIRDLLAPGAGAGASSVSASAASGPKQRARPASAKRARGPAGLELRESKERGVYVKDLTCFLVGNLAELAKLKRLGDRRRTTAATRMNEHSSRAHSILSITIETGAAETGGGGSGAAGGASGGARGAQAKAEAQGPLRLGRLHLIDLAGSERQSKSGSSGRQLKEASRINLSLTCLALVIRALTDNDATNGNNNNNNKPSHVPYRNSKLTRLLSSSLGGNSKTLLIACVSPARSSLDETLNTLRFASRTKQIKNRAVVNEDPKDALLRKYRRQLEELRAKLNERAGAPGPDQTAAQQVAQVQQPAHQEQPQRQQQQEEQQLMQQLELMKAKIMFGGENLLDKVELHERLLAASRQELRERQEEETKLRERLASKRQAIERVSKVKGSLEGQRAHLDERLQRALALYRRSKLELRDLASEHEQLRDELLAAIRATGREIKFADCVLEDFIPRDQLDLINAYAQYDDESDEWQIRHIALSGNNMAQTRRQDLATPADRVWAGALQDSDGRQSAAGARPKSRPPSNLNGGGGGGGGGGLRPDPFIRLT